MPTCIQGESLPCVCSVFVSDFPFGRVVWKGFTVQRRNGGSSTALQALCSPESQPGSTANCSGQLCLAAFNMLG